MVRCWFGTFELVVCPIAISLVVGCLLGGASRWHNVEHALRLRALLIAMRVVATFCALIDTVVLDASSSAWATLVTTDTGKYALPLGVGVLFVVSDIIRCIQHPAADTVGRLAHWLALLAVGLFAAVAFAESVLSMPAVWVLGAALLLRAAEAAGAYYYPKAFAVSPSTASVVVLLPPPVRISISQ